MALPAALVPLLLMPFAKQLIEEPGKRASKGLWNEILGSKKPPAMAGPGAYPGEPARPMGAVPPGLQQGQSADELIAQMKRQNMMSNLGQGLSRIGSIYRGQAPGPVQMSQFGPMEEMQLRSVLEQQEASRQQSQGFEGLLAQAQGSIGPGAVQYASTGGTEGAGGAAPGQGLSESDIAVARLLGPVEGAKYIAEKMGEKEEAIDLKSGDFMTVQTPEGPRYMLAEEVAKGGYAPAEAGGAAPETWMQAKTKAGVPYMVSSRGDVKGVPWHEYKPGDERPSASDVAGLRKEFTSQSGDFIKLRDAYNKITRLEPSAAGDHSLIIAYMKLVDPGSTVREGEYATVEQSTNWPGQVRQLYNKAVSGDKLTPEQRQDFLGQAQHLFGAQRESQLGLEETYKGIATRQNMDPANVVPDFLGDLRNWSPNSQGQTPVAAGPGPAPAPTTAQGNLGARRGAPSAASQMSDDELLRGLGIAR